MLQITIYSDYVCPYCLLAEKVVSSAIADRDITIVWHPFELRPAPEPTLRPEDPYLPSIWQRSVYPLAKSLGVPIKLPSISPQPYTAKAFELLAMAQDQNLGHDYSMRVLKAFFQEDQDIGNPEVLVELAAEVGLDPNKARKALDRGTYTKRHQDALRHSRDVMQIKSVPTIVVGDQIFRGTPSLEDLKHAINQIEEAQRSDSSQVSPHA